MDHDVSKHVEKAAADLEHKDNKDTTPFHNELFKAKSDNTTQLPALAVTLAAFHPPGGGGGGPSPAPWHPSPAPEPWHPAPAPQPAPWHPSPAPSPAPWNPSPAPRPEPAPWHPSPAPPRPEPAPWHPSPAPPQPRPEPPRPQPRPEPPRPQPRPEPPRPQPRPEPPRPEPPRPQPPRPEPPRPEPPRPQPPRPEPPRPEPPRPQPPRPEPPRPEPPRPEPPRPQPPRPEPPRPEPPRPQPPRPEPPRPEPPRPQPPRPEPPRPEPPHPRPEPPHPRPEPPHPPRPEPPHPRPEPRPEPPKPQPPHERPHPPGPVDHHPYHDGQPHHPPEGKKWGWEDPDKFHKGWDKDFFRHSPNYDRWHEHIGREAVYIGGLLNSCNYGEANRLINAELYDLRADRYAQCELLREIADMRQGNCAYLNLDRWNPDSGYWDTVEVVPAPPQPDPDTGDIPPVEPPTPIPTYDDDPWMKLEGTVVSSLLDAGDSQAAASRLTSDLYALRGNLDAQNALLGMVSSGDQKGTGSDLNLGNWNQDTGSYDNIEILPAGAAPGSGIQISEYAAADAAQPDGVIDTTKSNLADDPWMHQEIAVLGALLDGYTRNSVPHSISSRLNADLQALAGNMDAQNDLLAQVTRNHTTGLGADLVLGDWDPTKGTYSSIEVLPVGTAPGSGSPIQTYPDAPQPNPSDNGAGN